MTIMFEMKDRFGTQYKVEFGTMKLPNRKNKALVLMRGANVDVLGYFCSDDKAKRFEENLDLVIEGFNNMVR